MGEADEEPVDIELLPPRKIIIHEKIPRFRTGGPPLSPFILIDGKVIRSALLLNRNKKSRNVNFPANDAQPIAGCLEPENPWIHRLNLDRETLIKAYEDSCAYHKTHPLKKIVDQLQALNIHDERCEELCFEGETLQQNDCEALVEIFKRVLFRKVDLGDAITNDKSAEILFEMFEYYEAATYLDISCNKMIGTYGWQAFSRLIRKTPCVERVDARNMNLKEEYMILFNQGLRWSPYLHVLKLESCELSGRILELLVTALKFNTGLRELYLGDNNLSIRDSVHICTLLRFNDRLQTLDISDNNIEDDGMLNVINGLTHPLNYGKRQGGLECLFLRNNHLTRRSTNHINVAIVESKTLQKLDVSHNDLTDELLITIANTLETNEVLLELGIQDINLTCYATYEVAKILKKNTCLQKINMKDNLFHKSGMEILLSAVQSNETILEIDIDERPGSKIDCSLAEYTEILSKIHACGARNKELSLKKNLEDSSDEEIFEDEEGNKTLDKDEIAADENDNELNESQENELPLEYRRYMNWRI